MKNHQQNIGQIIKLALKEDIGTGDITSNLIVPKSKMGRAEIIVKQKGIICGLDIAKETCSHFDRKINFRKKVKEGTFVNPQTIAAELSGSFRSLLTVERTVLNFIQRMSGISTETFKYVEQLSGLNTKILDTRKTAPGQRLLDKYAVKKGGGKNHRIGLFDMILIKENHIAAAGSITKAVELCRKRMERKIKIEVEVSSIEELNEALANDVDIIMLDNMNVEMMKNAVGIIDHKTKIEASGGITLETIRKIAETGVDYISVGAITHSVKALDIAMYIQEA